MTNPTEPSNEFQQSLEAPIESLLGARGVDRKNRLTNSPIESGHCPAMLRDGSLTRFTCDQNRIRGVATKIFATPRFSSRTGL